LNEYNNEDSQVIEPVTDTIRHHNVKIASLNLKRSIEDLYARVEEFIKGESEAIRRVRKLVVDAAQTRSTVLIYGKTGTGKEPTADAIHYCSDRCGEPFEKLNCAAVPEDLLEDELFGHEKGAFTGAHQQRIGRFEKAHRGTLLLDEIGEMSLRLQAKLLRVLQERTFERLGSSRSLKVDVRILAATNRDLNQAVNEGRFRADLYYRLNVVEIYLPPLRDRYTDIPILVPHLLQKKQETVGWNKLVTFTPDALKTFCTYEYNWPGNIRELENRIERLGMTAAAGSGLITKDAVMEMFAGCNSDNQHNLKNVDWQEGTRVNQLLRDQERAIYTEALARANGNKSVAARLLGLDRSTFRSRLKKIIGTENDPRDMMQDT
jgi:transcriptional regulator with GAF, ATPase, and Fis domain